MVVMRRCGGCKRGSGPRNDQIQPKLGFCLILKRNWAVAPVKYALRAISLGVNGDCAGRGTQPTLAPPHARHCSPSALAFSRGRASGCKAQALQPAPPRADSALPNHSRALRRQMRLIAFVTEGTQESDGSWTTSVSHPSHHTYPRRAGHCCGMPDWATNWDGAAQPAPDFEVDQRINW